MTTNFIDVVLLILIGVGVLALIPLIKDTYNRLRKLWHKILKRFKP